MRRQSRWMGCYVLLGLVQSGMLPIILPLAAPPGPEAGFTYAAFAAAGIAAPFVGAWSDRHRRHPLTLAGGLLLAAAALLLDTLPGGLPQHMAAATLVGLGVSSASTVSIMFIVEVEPQAVWDRRIGTLQACVSAGQLVGLLLAGILGLRHVQAAFLLGAALLLLATPLALLTAPAPVVKLDRPSLPSRPARGGDCAPMGSQRSFHRVTSRAVAGLRHSPLAWFLSAWLLSYTATNGLSVMFSVALVRGYGATATLPTTAYAAGVGLSLLLYRPTGGWDARFGARTVLGTGLALRAVLVAGLLAAAALSGRAGVLPMLLCFGATQVVWPLLSVASNSLAVTLSPARRAESVGLLNAATSVGATVGGVVGGALLREGLPVLCAVVLGALLLALGLTALPALRGWQGQALP